ncbi:MAG: hypothetical protein IT371_14120 [Deltaproteobacteria bacterium]|nr:hypothetical protein [Deltaproteobacteria bacterium]
MLLVTLLVLLALAIGGAGWAHSRWGVAGWSPAGLLVAVLLVLWFSGSVRW